MKTKTVVTTLGIVTLVSIGYFYSVFSAPSQKDLHSAKLLASFQKQQNKQAKTHLLAPQPQGAGEYFAAKRLAKGKALPTKNYTDAIRSKRNFLDSQRIYMAEPWQSLGPYEVGGRTRSIIFHPNNPDIMYAGGVSGGVWKSEDAGGSWVALSDDMENLAVVTLAIMPDTPSTIIAGTGEGVYVGRPIVRSRGVEGNGIYRSVDDGSTWQAIDFTLDNPDFRFVNKIRVGADSTLFAATEKGIWRSTDVGDNWNLVLDQSDRLGGCHEIEIQPSSNPNQLLVSCGSFDASAVFRSTDNGDSWQSVLEQDNQGRTTIAYAPSNPSRVYALSAQNQFGAAPYGLNGLYRSDDSGLNWELVASPTSTNPNSRAMLSTTNFVFDCGGSNQYQPGRLAGGGWYYNLLTVDPLDENTVWTGGLDLWRSSDGGVNFDLASFWWASENLASFIHADHHLLIYHPNYDGTSETRLFASNDGGIWHTQNPTANVASDNCDPLSSQVDWQPLNTNYAVTQFYHGSVASDGDSLIGGSQDNGTQYRDSSGQWQRILGGDGSYSAIDPKDSNTVYVSSQYANLYRLDLSGNNPQSTRIGGQFDAPGLFITPFVIDPNDNQQLWLAGLALWHSSDRGDNWQKVSRDEYTQDFINGLSALAVQPGNSNLLILGGSDGHIYRHTSATSGTSVFEMQKIKIADGYVSSVNFDRNNPDKVVATVSTFGQPHAWLSDDAGVTWQSLDAAGVDGLPDLPSHDIIVAPHDTNTLYVGTDIGVYISENNGGSWQPLTTGLPNVPVEKLVYNRSDLQSQLFAFTYGRGSFKSLLTDIQNFAPVANRVSFDFGGVEGDPVDIDLSDNFDDPNGDNLSFSVTNLPATLSVDSSGLLTGTNPDAGSYSANLTVSDGDLEVMVVLNFNVLEGDDGASSSGGGSLGWLLIGVLCLRRKFVRSEI